MAPNNFLVPVVASEGKQKEEEVHEPNRENDPHVLNVSSTTQPFFPKKNHINNPCTQFLQRKSKNSLNSYDSSNKKVDLNGNVEKGTKENTKEEEYRIEFAWFNICGFIYLHYAAVIGMSITRVDSLGVFGKFIGLIIIFS